MGFVPPNIKRSMQIVNASANELPLTEEENKKLKFSCNSLNHQMSDFSDYFIVPLIGYLASL